MRHKKILAAAATAAAAGLVLSGCSGSSGDSSNTVTMWIYPVIADEKVHKEYWNDLIEEFESAHEGINVEYEIYPWANRDESLSSAIAAGKGPDLVYLIPDQLPTYANSLEPLDEHLPKEQLGDLLPNVKDAVTFDGNTLGAPILTSSNALMCDASAFEGAGVSDYPETWDDLKELAPVFKEHDIYITQYFASPDVTLNMTFYPLLWQAGGSVFNDDGTDVAFDNKAGVEALTLISDFAKEGYIESDLISTMPSLEQTALASDRVACTWQSGPVDAEAFWGEDNIVIQPPLTNEEQVSYGTVGSLSMLKNSDAKDAASSFLSYATNPENSTEYDLASGNFSPYESTGALYPNDPVLGPIEETIPMSRVGELFPSSREVMGVLAPEIQAALLGNKTPKQALKDAAAAAEPLIN